MNKYINYFLNYLQTEKDASPITIKIYKANLKKLFQYLNTADINAINQNHLRDYLNQIRQTYNYASSSIANKINYSITSLVFFITQVIQAPILLF